MLLLNGRHRLCFILPPKCATRSIEKALNSLGAELFDGRHGVCPKQLASCPVRIASIRNPFDVLVSWYHYSDYGYVSGRSFFQYLQYDCNKNTHLLTSCLPHADLANKYIRYEDDLELQLNIILSDSKYPQVKLDKIGESDRRPYWDYYDLNSKGFVENKYYKDLDKYEYSFCGY